MGLIPPPPPHPHRRLPPPEELYPPLEPGYTIVGFIVIAALIVVLAVLFGSCASLPLPGPQPTPPSPPPSVCPEKPGPWCGAVAVKTEKGVEYQNCWEQTTRTSASWVGPCPEPPMPPGVTVCTPEQTCGCWHRPIGELWQSLPDCPAPAPGGCVLAGEPSVVAEDQPNSLGDQVNAAMVALRPDCDVGGTCLLGDVRQQEWQAAVEAKLRETGLCAGQHAPHTDEIAVAARAGDPWQGFHVFVGDDSDGPVPTGGARRTVKWSPAAYTGAWMPPGTPEPPVPRPQPGDCSDPKPSRDPENLTISLKVESWADGTLQTKRTCAYCQAIGMGDFNGVIRCSCPMRSECPGFRCEERGACEAYVAGSPVWQTEPAGNEIVLRGGNPWVARCVGCIKLRVCTEDLRVCSEWKVAP